jgi:hypothetical protein
MWARVIALPSNTDNESPSLLSFPVKTAFRNSNDTVKVDSLHLTVLAGSETAYAEAPEADHIDRAGNYGEQRC